MPATINAALDTVWRIESPKLVAALTRIVRDVGLAEDLAQDALVAAMETWPSTGVPKVPGAWLMTTARRRAIDALRRREAGERAHRALTRDTQRDPPVEAADAAAEMDDDVGDDLLRLVFMTCHPVLSTESRVALTLRLVGGLTTEEVARAFLVPTGARTGQDGEPVLLADQDRSRWDRLLISRGLSALARAERLGLGLGPYGLQAAIAACHARARRAEETDWTRIAAL